MGLIKPSFLVVLSLFFSGCPQPEADFVHLPKDVQTISLLGDTLRSSSNPLPERLSLRIDSLIQTARAKNDSISVVIWQARKLGYEGNYREAITYLQGGFEKSSDTEIARLLRHQGHRYLTLRAFDHAKSSLMHASGFIKGHDDVVEEDGLPNALNKPTSSLHTNIWYHLGLAYYVTGDFKKAQKAYQNCIKASTNDDMLAAASYWYYMTLKRSGQNEDAQQVLNSINSEMEIIENDSYLKLLLLFKGELDPQLLFNENTDALSNATIGYGIGNWHYINDRKEQALSVWRQVYEGESWASFGYIASETELARNYE